MFNNTTATLERSLKKIHLDVAFIEAPVSFPGHQIPQFGHIPWLLIQTHKVTCNVWCSGLSTPSNVNPSASARWPGLTSLVSAAKLILIVLSLNLTKVILTTCQKSFVAVRVCVSHRCHGVPCMSWNIQQSSLRRVSSVNLNKQILIKKK